MKHGNAKIDWPRVERLYEAKHPWKHIAYMARYEGDPDKLRAQFHARKQTLRLRAAKEDAAVPWPRQTHNPDNPDNWPDYSTENVPEKSGVPVKIQAPAHNYYSDRPSSAGFAA